MPVRKRQNGSVTKKGGEYKKKRQDTAHEKHEATDTDNFFMDEEDGAPQPDEEEAEEIAETAEQKRLRLGPPKRNLALGWLGMHGREVCNWERVYQSDAVLLTHLQPIRLYLSTYH
jgi:hypothetical protein